MTPHYLRHAAASLPITAGADVKQVQNMLGHATARLTLDTYAGLWDAGIDAVADAVGAQLGDTPYVSQRASG